jgi:hypothetical protein
VGRDCVGSVDTGMSVVSTRRLPTALRKALGGVFGIFTACFDSELEFPFQNCTEISTKRLKIRPTGCTHDPGMLYRTTPELLKISSKANRPNPAAVFKVSAVTCDRPISPLQQPGVDVACLLLRRDCACADPGVVCLLVKGRA